MYNTSASNNTTNTSPANSNTNNATMLIPTKKMNAVKQLQQQQQLQQIQQQPPPTISIDYSDLSNFNTLVTVAAAQTPSVSPNRPVANNGSKTINNILKNEANMQSPLITSNDSNNSNSDVIDHTKMPISLSQMNTSINHEQNFNTIISTSSVISNSSKSNQGKDSSNTIRNLLAMGSPSLNISNSLSSNSGNKLANPNGNLRLSTGGLLFFFKYLYMRYNK
jgi:hypothetical protein